MEFKKIKSIRRSKKAVRVYNFDVPQFETYIANGFVVHNCQNWKVSQNNRHESARTIMPINLIQIAIEKSCDAICFTYNEPTVYYEYIMSAAFYAKDKGLKVILKTNATLHAEPWKDIVEVVDALNIDWKGDTDEAKQAVGIDFNIIPNIRAAIELKKHVEISIPVYNNSRVEDYYRIIFAMAKYPHVPIHLLKIFPAYLIQLANTIDDAVISNIKDVFSKHCRYVYTPNDRNTICPLCKVVNVKRHGFTVTDEEYSIICEQCSILFKQTHG